MTRAARREGFLLVLALAAFNALLAFLVAAWLHALRYDAGIILWCVDCLGEGLPELVLFAVLLGLGVAAQALVLVRGVRGGA